MNKTLIKSILIGFTAIAFTIVTEAQIRKTNCYLPDAGEYKVLKGDFHIHTVFSDGSVWPSTRVEEAYIEDLDVIVISDHIEYCPNSSEFSTKDHNRAYELAKDAAERYGIILIRGAEITREMPPGHINVINIKDANPFETYVNKENKIDSARFIEALVEAKRQGGFIFWNHPAFPTPDNKSTWHPAHQRMLEQGLMMGIEVANGERYEPIVFQWCIDHNLTILSNTDVHGTMAQKRSMDGFKVMTLVLAKSKTPEAIMDALRNRRTVALWNNQLFGRKEHVEPIIQNSIKAILHNRGGKYLFEYVNVSGVPIIIQPEVLPEGVGFRNDFAITVNPYETVALSASVSGEIPTSLKVKIFNVWLTPNENLEMVIPITYIQNFF